MKSSNKISKLSEIITPAFDRRNIPTIFLADIPSVVQAGYGCKQKRFWYSEINAVPGYKLSSNKEATLALLRQAHIPVAKGFACDKAEEISEILTSLKYPLVVKPATGTYGGQGVAVNLQTENEVKKCFQTAIKLSRKVLIEEFIPGDDYRVLVLGGKVIAAAKRTPAAITTDGKTSINDLIESENIRRSKITGFAKNTQRVIKIDETTNRALEIQGYNLKSVPPAGEKILVRLNANISTGGESHNVTDIVHPKTKEICRRAARLIGLEIAGIDIITTDISQPLETNGGRIIEINNCPGLTLHIFPNHGDSIDVPKIIANYLVPDPKEAWIPITINQKNCTDSREVEKHYHDLPQKVVQISSPEKEKTITKPEFPVLIYLLDPLTKAIDIN